MLWPMENKTMKKAVLEALKNQSEGFISGEHLSTSLGVTRTMVWKIITQLRTEGYSIESSSRKGYRLNETSDLFSQSELDLLLVQQEWVRRGLYFDTIDSTNTYGKRLALETNDDPILILADEQQAGRGRLGRQWHSKKGDGLWLSLILRPAISPEKSFMTTLIAAVSVAEAIQKVTGLEAGVKWPNDIIVNRKKVCGILTEMSAEWQTVNYLVVGIGINVNQGAFPEEIAGIASSLKLETGGNVKRHDLLSAVLSSFGYYAQALIDPTFYDLLIDKYKSLSVTVGQTVRVIGSTEKIGKAIDINHQGELVVVYEDGTSEAVYHGEVSVRGLDYYI